METVNQSNTGNEVKTAVPFGIWANLSIFSVFFSVGSVMAGQSRNFGLGTIGLTNIINLPSEVIPPLGLFGSTLLFIPVCWLTIWYVKGEEVKLPSNKEHPAKLWRKRFPITENMDFATPYAQATQYFWLITFLLFPLIAQVQLRTC